MTLDHPSVSTGAAAYPGLCGLKAQNIEKVEKFLEPFEMASFDDLMTYVYADIRDKTEKKGANVGPNDLFIAAIVKFYEGILVTNNVREFKSIEGLLIENWVK